jgi:1-acyl-sn-glycerol-3-phosphate acyltransferase
MHWLLLPLRLLYTIHGWIVIGCACVIFGFLYRCVAFPFVPAWREPIPRLWGRSIMAFLTRYEVRGFEHLPEGPCAVLTNHASFLDIPLVQALPRDFRFVAKRLFAALPGFRTVLLSRGDILVDKSAGGIRQNSRSMIRTIEVGCGPETLKTWHEKGLNRVLVVYAEGTRSRDGQLKPFRTRHLARHIVQAGLPVVPAAIQGAYRLCPPGFTLFNFSRLRITFTPPVFSDDPVELLDLAHDQVAAVLQSEAYP